MKSEKVNKKKKKGIVKTLRLSEDENDALKDLLKRESLKGLGSYVRNLINNQSRAFTLSPDEIKFLKSEFANLTRFGSNINQITFHINRRYAGKSDEIIKDNEESQLLELLKTANETIEHLQGRIVKLINEAS